MKINPINFNRFKAKQPQKNQTNQNITFSKRDILSFGNYKPIDINNWNRNQIYGLYSQAVQPFWSVTIEADVSNLIKTAKDKKINRSYAIYYILSKTANEITAFKQRMKNGIPVTYDKVALSGTVAKPDGLFNFQHFEHFDNPKEFIENIDKRMKEAKERKSLFPNNRDIKDPESYIYASCAPTFQIKSMTNAFVIAQQDDSTPRIFWDKPTADNEGNIKINLAFEVNHKFIDGYHVNQFIKQFEKNARNSAKIFKDL